jgi:hypothetical protein
VNGATRWRSWRNSGSPLAAEAFGLIARVKLNLSSACLALGKNPRDNSILAVPDESFGFNVNKVHRTINDNLKDLELEQFAKRVRTDLPKDDQRRKAFEASDCFSNSFPISIDSSVPLDSHEFTTAIQRKLGCPVTMLAQFVGHSIATNGKSRRLRVDAFGNSAVAAPGVSGDHARTTHDAFNTMVIQCIKEVGIRAVGGGFGSCKGIFSKSINQSNVRPEDEDLINGIIPDGLIDGRGAPVLDGHDPTKLHNMMTLIETKGLGTVNGETVQQRADRINRDYVRHAEDIDEKLPGSKVLDELNRYGVDGKVLALVIGSLGNCSPDLLVVIDFIAATKTVRALEFRTANLDQLFSMHRRFLISSFGLFTTRLWARHIHDRFRDAVSAQAPSPRAHQLPDPDREVTREFHSGFTYPRRAQHRGSRRGA